jgi:hypothetical protein
MFVTRRAETKTGVRSAKPVRRMSHGKSRKKRNAKLFLRSVLIPVDREIQVMRAMPDSEAAEKFPNRAGPFVFLNDKKKKRKQMPPQGQSRTG